METLPRDTKDVARLTRRLVIGLLSQETERDKQVKVGASNMSNLCEQCLARDLVGNQPPRGKYYMGSVIGTAIHALLEERAQGNPRLHSEKRVTIGVIDGYGEVKSTTDLYDEELENCVDFKTTTREKLAFYRMVPDLPYEPSEVQELTKARATMNQYAAQMLLYGLGLSRAGYKVSYCTMVFIARDAKTEEPEDIWAHTIVYSEKLALKVFDRVVSIYDLLAEGAAPEEFDSHPLCYICSTEEAYR